jgi:hypothetical protein
MNPDNISLDKDLLNFVVPSSSQRELFQRLGYSPALTNASDLMVFEVAEMTGKSPHEVFQTLLDISSNEAEERPMSDKNRIEHLERELAQTKDLVENIPRRFTMDPKQRMAQSVFAMIVAAVIFLVFIIFVEAQRPKTDPNPDLNDRLPSEISR